MPHRAERRCHQDPERKATAKLLLYTKPGCHLCDEMKTVVAKLAGKFAVDLEEVDISGDAGLMQKYGDQIPVLMLDGRKIAKYRISETDLIRRIDKVQVTN
ncbi:MAG: glutaredoxin family protein [Acidobacteria bacterium]|nr:glutaredoxin family protein [Acidobacteriota bacterium]